MKKSVMAVVVAVFAVFLFTHLIAAEKPTAAAGKALFNDKTLGGATSGRSCGTCHPDGKGLENAGNRPDLAAMVNRCIVGAEKGQKIAEDSVEMESIILYLKSLKSGNP